MKNFTDHEIGFPLDWWIDTKTGEFLEKGIGPRRAARELAYALKGGVQHIFYNHDSKLWNQFDYAQNAAPDIDVSGVTIRFSDKILRKEKMVHPGIGDRDECESRRECHEPDPECPRDAMDAISRDRLIKHKYLVLGEFKPSWRSAAKIGTITLYTKAIAEYSGNGEADYGVDYETAFWATLAHEAFHAYHYSLFKKTGRQDRWRDRACKKEREIETESLAAHAEYVFLLNHEGNCLDADGAGYMMDALGGDCGEWRTYDVEDWPYSGALGIGGLSLADAPVTSPDFVQQLLRTSLYDWKTASDIIRTGYYLADPGIRDCFK